MQNIIAYSKKEIQITGAKVIGGEVGRNESASWRRWRFSSAESAQKQRLEGSSLSVDMQ